MGIRNELEYIEVVSNNVTLEYYQYSCDNPCYNFYFFIENKAAIIMCNYMILWCR